MAEAIWILVADSGAARIFTAGGATGPLTELESIAHPEGRLPARELTSDLPGRAFDSAGQGRHIMEKEVGPRQQAATDFAHLLAGRLEQARAQGGLQRLALVAPPEFLGLLREALGRQLQRLVVLEQDRNLVRMTADEIRARLPERLYPLTA